jgi:molybdopterin/thiamine biosynthesis adenylyltransferase/rhodanese-related sulfurtransferase
MDGLPGKSPEVTALQAHTQACPSRPLIDIRNEDERQLGVPAAARIVEPDSLMNDGLPGGTDDCRGGFILCAEGNRSLELVNTLESLGISGFYSVKGGFQAWQAAGLPVGYPAGLDAIRSQRYARHLVMPQIGLEGQQKLSDSRILLVGLGGLNSPAALYLAAAGVGKLGLVDDDRVERSNLQRQILYGENLLGARKTESAASALAHLNPDVETEAIDCRVNEENASEMIRNWDVVIDGTDNFPARYALNDACAEQSTPLVYGAVMRFQGQVSVFCAGGMDGSVPCFRCLMPRSPAPEDIPGCSDAGVLGVMPGIVGTLQANEAIKLVLGVGRSLAGRLLMIDALNMQFHETRIRRNPDCPACGAE